MVSDSISEYEPAVETLGPLYDMHWPTRQFETARDLRLSPMCNRMLGLGAVMGELVGWERPHWFATEQETKYRYTYGKPNWFEECQRECRVVEKDAVDFHESWMVPKIICVGYPILQ